MFRALVLNKDGQEVRAGVEELDEARLPEGDVTVAVEHSTLNYKDGLIIANKAPLVRSYPHVPGVDLAGLAVVLLGALRVALALGDEAQVGERVGGLRVAVVGGLELALGAGEISARSGVDAAAEGVVRGLVED